MDLALTPGADPYDALSGRRVPSVLKRHPSFRQLAIQLRKRIPVETGRLIGAEPRLMAKALGCFLAAEARAVLAGEDSALGRAESIVAALPQTGGAGSDGAWGYEFDVQTRWGYYAAGTPNLIATTFVGRGFLEAGLAFRRDDWVDQARLSAQYLKRVHLAEGASGPYVRYTPDSSRLVHNANLLGAGFIAAVGAVVGEPEWVSLACDAAHTSIAGMSPNGEWPYGTGVGLGWDDNFHTAYDLDGLSWVCLAAPDVVAESALRIAADSWARDFFGEEGEPHYYRATAYPYDIHSAATAVDVACRLAMRGVETGIQDRVARWAKTHLTDPVTGLTYYQVHRLFTDRRNFRRWGDAHWSLAMSALRLRALGADAPFENAARKFGRHLA